MAEMMRRAVEWAKRAVVTEGDQSLESRHFLAAISGDSTLAEAVRDGLALPAALIVPADVETLGARLNTVPTPDVKIPLGDHVKAVYGEMFTRHGGRVPFAGFFRELLRLPDDPFMRKVRELNEALVEVLSAP